MEEGVTATRKRQRIEESHSLPPRNRSLFQLTQSELKTTFQEAQAYFSEKGTFQCPFCANHINHNYLQTHIKYCSNLFEQFFTPPTRLTVVPNELSMKSDVNEQTPSTKHRIRCLIHELKGTEAIDSFVSKTLTRAGLTVKFANVKVPSAENFPKKENPRYNQFRQKNPYNVTAKCYVELESTNDEETLLVLHNTFNKNTITVLPKQKVETFIRPNFNWYPDIMSVILSFFQSPPENTKGFHQANSYIRIFCEYSYDSYADFNNWPLYFMKLAMKIDAEFFSEIPSKWRCNKQVIIATLESKSKFAPMLPQIPELLQQDTDILAAFALTDSSVFTKIPKDKMDKNFILHCIRYGCSFIVKYIPKEFLNDGAFVLKLLQNDSKILRYFSSSKISPDAFADEAITSQLLAINGSILRFAPNDVKKNRRLVLIAVKQDAKSLQYADNSLLEDREVVLTAVQKSGCTLKFASEKLREDKQVVMTAIQDDHYALEFASSTLRKDKELIQLASKAEQLEELHEVTSPEQRRYIVYTKGIERGTFLHEDFR